MGGDRNQGGFPKDFHGKPSAEYLDWAESGAESADSGPEVRLSGFRDPLLERAYLRGEHTRGRRYFTISLSVAFALIASFLWMDQWLVPPELFETFRNARLYVLLPACLLLTINAVWIADPILWIRQCAALILIYGLAHAALLVIGGQSVFQYLEIGMLEAILGTSLLLGLPVRWSVPIILLFGLAFGACTLHVETDMSPFVNFCVDFAVYSFLGISASYRYEDIARREFVARMVSRKESAERIAAEADRRRWLEVIAGFLQHELKNSMAAISTSIEIADRVSPQSEAGKYLDRGRRSVEYMHVLLNKVADATNLESALAQHEFEPINLSVLLMNRVDDFRADTPGRAFSTDIEPDVQILGHGDSLIQMLDKLINNAVEHGDPQSPIHIGLKNAAQHCEVRVSDVGDALPADASQIFEPFVTKKIALPGAANLGLGLFIARAIAIDHGGTIRAQPLADPSGACFIVELPRHPGALSAESSDSRDPVRFESGQIPRRDAGRLHESP